MKDMALSPEEKKDAARETLIADRPNYPYGLRLQIDPESYDKLQLSEAPEVGKKFLLLAEVEVVSLEKGNHKDDVEKYSMGLQVTKMELSKGKKEEKEESQDISEKLYGE